MPRTDAGVYKITNLVNGKFYIGSASYLPSRLACHKCELKKGIHRNKHLQRSYNLYGEQAFKYEVILRCDRDMTVWYEQRCIDFMNPEYNTRKVAQSNQGVKLSDEHKAAVSRAQKGKRKPSPSLEVIERRAAKVRGTKRHPLSDEVKKKISVSRSGKRPTPEAIEKTASKLRGRHGMQHVSDETRSKLSNIHLGLQKHSDETKRKIGEYWTGRRRSISQIEKMKPNKISHEEAIDIHRMHNEEHLTARQICAKLGKLSYAQVCLILNGKSRRSAHDEYYGNVALRIR